MLSLQIIPQPAPALAAASPPPGIVLDPAVYTPPPSWRAPGHMCRALLRAPVSKEFWATPRANVNSVSHVLTERSSLDLGTQVRFERDTPDAVRPRIHISPRFLEWLMGFPSDWTSGGRKKKQR